MFDATQHPLGQGAGQRAHAEVTSEAEKPRVPLHVKHLKEALVSRLAVSFLTGWFDSAVQTLRRPKRRLNPATPRDGWWGKPPFSQPVFAHVDPD